MSFPALGLLFILLLSCGVAHTQAQDPLLLENPTLSQRHIAFSYGGDIWTVDRSGGSARRLTTDPAREASPVIEVPMRYYFSGRIRQFNQPDSACPSAPVVSPA